MEEENAGVRIVRDERRKSVMTLGNEGMRRASTAVIKFIHSLERPVGFHPEGRALISWSLHAGVASVPFLTFSVLVYTNMKAH